MEGKKKFHFIACEIIFREVCYCAAKSRSVIDVTFMPKKLHDLGEAKMSEALQRQINLVDASKYDAILMGYGLCNYGVRGLHADIPLVIPRAHDCITLMMGSKELYMEYFNNNPGTYFHSSGWIERDSETGEEGIASQLGIDKTYEEYAGLYGEEAAEYLSGMLGGWLKNYKKVAYIDTGLGDRDFYASYAKKYADEREWEFEEVKGNMGLMMKLMDGEWNDGDFLVVPPSGTIEPSYDEAIVHSCLCHPCNS